VIRKWVCAVLVCAALTGIACADNISAGSAILIDAESGAVFYEKNADQRRLIASTTKIMTALVVLDSCALDDVVEVPAACEYVGGSSMYLRAGEQRTVRELLYGLMLLSGNDAALALALHVGGGDAAVFVERMNEYAARLGLEDTSFENPHGLDGAAQYSSARDLARLAAHAMENEAFAKIVGTREITLEGHTMRNHNKLLWRIDGACGVKTGYTQAAGRCLVSCVMRNGRSFVAVTLGAPNDWDDHEVLYGAIFDALAERVLVTRGETAAEVPCVSGGAVRVVYGTDVMRWLTPGEAECVEIRLDLPPFIYGGRMRGERAGSADILVSGSVADSVELYYDGMIWKSE